jgi:hypothetical protein
MPAGTEPNPTATRTGTAESTEDPVHALLERLADMALERDPIDRFVLTSRGQQRVDPGSKWTTWTTISAAPRDHGELVRRAERPGGGFAARSVPTRTGSRGGASGMCGAR